MTLLGGGLNTNKNNDSFLFIPKNKIRNKNRQNDSFYDIKSNSKRNFFPFNFFVFMRKNPVILAIGILR